MADAGLVRLWLPRETAERLKELKGAGETWADFFGRMLPEGAPAKRPGTLAGSKGHPAPGRRT